LPEVTTTEVAAGSEGCLRTETAASFGGERVRERGGVSGAEPGWKRTGARDDAETSWKSVSIVFCLDNQAGVGASAGSAPAPDTPHAAVGAAANTFCFGTPGVAASSSIELWRDGKGAGGKWRRGGAAAKPAGMKTER